MAKTIIDLLEDDHRNVEQLFEQISGAASEARAGLFSELKADLELHTAFEEDVFYPAARQATGMDDEIDDDLEEHQEVKAMLDQLAELDAGSEEWSDLIEDLAAAIEHHVRDEEDELFPVVREECETDALERMAQQYLARKEEVKAGGVV